MKLRDIKEADFSAIKRLTKNKDVMKFIGNGKIWDDEKIERFIDYNLFEQNQNINQRKNYYYKISIKNTFIGIIGAHTMKGRKGLYLTTMIEKKHQGKGYYKKAFDLFKIILKEKKIKEDILKSLVRKNNNRMNDISNKYYYFNKEVKINREEFNEYFIFLRKLTYLFKSDYYKLTDLHLIMKERGIWRPFREDRDKNPDFLHLDGKHQYDKKLYKYKCLLKNVLVSNPTITKKDELYENIEKIRGGKKYLIENYNLTFRENKNKFKHLFDGKTPWMIKPVNSCQGKGIEIFIHFIDFIDYFKNIDKYDIRDHKRFALQKYITNPLLFKGRKFHMRYHIICYDGEIIPLEVAPVYTAKKKFNLNNLCDKDVHDSHYESSLKDIIFPYSFDLKKKEIEKINKQILDLFKKCVSLIDFDCYEESKKCYHVYGADIMILDDLSVKLLEINNRLGLLDSKYFGESYNNHLFRQEMQFVVDKIFPPN